jgi:GPH family glycoside/pentoside/hexuronide:cation symporter
MFILGSIVSQFSWFWASARLGKVTALMLRLLLYVVVLIGVWANLPATGVATMARLLLLAVAANGPYQQIPWAMYPDLIDVTRAKKGTAIERAFSDVWLFGQKVANALAPLALGLILQPAGWKASHGGTVDQCGEALGALRLSLTLVP